MAGVGLRVRAAAKAVVGIFNEQSARQAWGLLSGIAPGGRGEPPPRGTAEYLRAYSQMPWLRAVAGRVASRVATAEWHLYRVGKPQEPARRDRLLQRAKSVRRRTMLKDLRQRDELTEITDHPALDLLHDANSFQTGESVRKVTQLHLDLVGEAYWLKERNALGTVVGIWPIPPNWILATPTPSYRFFRVQFRAWRGPIPDTEILWMADPDPANPYGRGSGTAQALADELETDEYAAKHAKQLFFNGARPDFVVYPKNGTLQDSNVARLEEDWISKNQGFWRAFKPHFLNREVGIHDFKEQGNLRALQLVPLREFERNAVLQTFGMPPELLGVLENSNRATITAADLVMGRYVVEPRLEFLRSCLQERLIPEFDERLVLDYDSPVQDDKDFQLEVAKAAPFALDVDEWRDLGGLPQKENEEVGALIFVPSLMSAKTEDDLLNPPDPPPVAIPGAPRPMPARPAPAPAKASGDEPETTTLADRLEGGLARDLAAAWGDVAAAVNEEALVQALADHDEALVVATLLPAREDGAVGRLLTLRLADAFVRGAAVGARPLRAVGVVVRAPEEAEEKGPKPALVMDLGAVHPMAADWARQHAADLLDAPARTQGRVRRLVAQAIDEGVPPRELARMLRGVVGLTEQQAEAVANFRRRLRADGVSVEDADRRTARYGQAKRRERALTIARTELVAAVNAGQQALWEQAIEQGLVDEAVMRKVWIVTNDELLESRCEALDGESVPVGEDFSSGVAHPPLHPRCRCAVALQAVKRRR